MIPYEVLIFESNDFNILGEFLPPSAYPTNPLLANTELTKDFSQKVVWKQFSGDFAKVFLC